MIRRHSEASTAIPMPSARCGTIEPAAVVRPRPASSTGGSASTSATVSCASASR